MTKEAMGLDSQGKKEKAKSKKTLTEEVMEASHGEQPSEKFMEES